MNTPESTPEFTLLRGRMVDEQLKARDIVDERVLAAMAEVPRERFMPDELRDAAYDDGAFVIGQGQTISQPYTVAYMCQALRLRGAEHVLEVGTGSGYGAAVLGRLAHRVTSIERRPDLADQARRRLQTLGYDDVRVVTGDGTRGRPEEAPFDAIIVTAGAATLPEALIAQLHPAGTLVIPIDRDGAGQTMYRCTFDDRGRLRREDLGSFAFVPLVGRYDAPQS